MMRIVFAIMVVLSISIPTYAAELTAPTVPQSGLENMPQNTDSLGDGLWELLQKCLKLFQKELKNAFKICFSIFNAAMLFSLIPILTEKLKFSSSIAGAVTIASVIFQNTNAMIGYATDTIWEICEYGKLLCPTLTTALAAQGGISASALLYTGTTAFLTLLNILVSRLMIPMVYLFLTFSVAHCALGEQYMKLFADTVKKLLSWLLKTMLIVFTTYMGITGIVSGTTDAAALKAAKITISSVVPVVGGILSDASESVLVSMGIVKNAAGIYGILAVLSVFVGPFVKIGVQHLLLKLSAVVCSLFSNKNLSALVDDFSTAMGLLLAMVGAGCVIVLISTICFLKGIG